MSPAVAAAHILFGSLALLGPGWFFAKRMGWPSPVFTGAALAMVAWFEWVLVCDGLSIPLEPLPLFGGWLTLVVIGVVATRRRASTTPPRRRFGPFLRENLLWVAAVVFALTSLALRALIDPLSGWDNSFRWNHLAVEILARGNLDFYPATSAPDFEIMAWSDGMPPLVPLLNLWFYLLAGEAAPVLTAGRVIGEALLLFGLVAGLARRWAGENAAWPAAGLVATSALVLWSIVIGQETGLTAIALVGMIRFLPERDDAADLPMTIAAALFAALGALSREYGLSFGVLGLITLALRDRPRKSQLVFAAVWFGLAAPWYVRNWFITGNPFHPLDLFGLFPTPPAYGAISTAIADHWGWSSQKLPLASLVLSLVATAGGIIGVGCWAIIRLRKTATLTAWLGVGLVVLLWIWAVPQTAGGRSYGLRVLSPALALLAALGGAALARQRATTAGLVSVLALLLAADAAKRMWLLPIAPRISPWTETQAVWRGLNSWQQGISRDPAWTAVANAARGNLILVDSPSAHEALRSAGGRASMLFSPVADLCFDPNVTPTAALAGLRAAGVGLLVLSPQDPVMQRVFRNEPFFAALLKTPPTAKAPGEWVVWSLSPLSESNL